MAFWSKFFGSAGSQAAGFAIGLTAVPALEPGVQEIVNTAWSAAPVKPLPLVPMAQGVATRKIDDGYARGQAAMLGVSGDRFEQLVAVFEQGPGVSAAFELWRRGLTDAAGFENALREEGLRDEWVAALRGLHDVLLSPHDLAMARQQGFVDQARAESESALQGVTAERADLLFELAGLPPGIDPATEALHRGFIDDAGFAQIVREGHTKTKYTDLLLRLAKPLLRPATIVNLYLRGWITQADYHGRMAAWGYEAGQADDWYDASGRPAAPVQMYTAWARDVTGPDGSAMDETQFLKGIRESDIRPEWGPMLWGNRWNYPSLFQLRSAVQDGGITRDRALTILKYERYEHADAVALVDAWLRPTATGPKGLTAAELVAEYEGLYLTRAELVADLQAMGYSATTAAEKANAADARRTRLARNAAIAAIQKRYEEWRATEADVRTRLGELNVTTDAADHLLTLWGYERADKLRLLTPAQIKKAVGANLLTRADALTELEQLGYTAADATILLDE